MIRVYVIVEGQTEEAFVKGPMAEFFWNRQIYLVPRLLGVPGHKGGNTNYERVRKDIENQLKQDKSAYCTTMLDFYGLGKTFPGRSQDALVKPVDKAIRIESAWKADVCNRIPDTRPDLRFIPYLSLHEFEALLFSEPLVLAETVGQPNLGHKLAEIRNAFTSPEDINDSPDTAPSKRIPSYRKVLHGAAAAQKIGLAKMQRECPHFAQWLDRLLTLSPIP